MLYDKTLRKYIYFRDNCRCSYCLKQITLRNCTLDHYYPRAEGGPDAAYNLLLCCKACNKIKGSAIPDDWQEVFVLLFKKAVEDGIITPKDNRISLKQLAPLVTRLEQLSKQAVFQGEGVRLYVTGNTVTSAVNIANE